MNNKLLYTIFGILAIFIWTTNAYPFRIMIKIFGSFLAFAIILGIGGLIGLITHNIQTNIKRTIFNKTSVLVVILFVCGVILSSLVFGTSPVGDVLLQTMIINCMWTVLVNICLVLLLNYKIKHKVTFYVGILMAIIGVILSCVGFDFNKINFIKYFPHYYPYYIYACLASISWTLYSVFLKKYENMFEDDHVYVGLIIAGLISLIIYLCNHYHNDNRNDHIQIKINFLNIGCMIYEILIFSYLSHYFWNTGIKKGNIKVISNFSLLIPVLNVIFASLFFGLNVFNGELMGAFILIIAMLLCRYSIMENTNEFEIIHSIESDKIFNPMGVMLHKYTQNSNDDVTDDKDYENWL